jgi:hypothetical protein
MSVSAPHAAVYAGFDETVAINAVRKALRLGGGEVTEGDGAATETEAADPEVGV